jgi:phospholipid transport system transporter-binding protein
MTEAGLTSVEQRRRLVSGSLDFDTVPGLWAQLAPQLDGGDWVLDLHGVERANSAGLLLLLEAHAETTRHGGRLRVEGLPDSLQQLGRMTGLGTLFGELQA